METAAFTAAISTDVSTEHSYCDWSVATIVAITSITYINFQSNAANLKCVLSKNANKQEVHDAAKIHSLMKIPLKTIYCNLKKIEDTSDIKCKSGSGRIKKIMPNTFEQLENIFEDNPPFLLILLQKIKEYWSRWQFQQDNDPKHISHIAKEFLDNNVPVVMDWSSNSLA
ncbi:2702_t:CDS:2 [Ambispora leptoticha]|uniref:2702_t:CDS:1 n=1 Tax=Ambispora leptoticha TaxID=144679 RepID=A0A9N9FVG8_9GLOM|nr:2702_t:CDS:2 [Ambispora leptoticha]